MKPSSSTAMLERPLLRRCGIQGYPVTFTTTQVMSSSCATSPQKLRTSAKTCSMRASARSGSLCIYSLRCTKLISAAFQKGGISGRHQEAEPRTFIFLPMVRGAATRTLNFLSIRITSLDQGVAHLAESPSSNYRNSRHQVRTHYVYIP